MTRADERRFFDRSTSTAVVVEVPSEAWIAPITAQLRDRYPWSTVFSRGQPSKFGDVSRDAQQSASDLLAQGGRVLGVSHAPDRLLPPALVAGADLRIKVIPPTSGTVAKLIERITGSRVRVPAGIATGLDFDDLTSAVRLNSRPGECIRRLEAAKAMRSQGDPTLADVPLLHTLHGYGPAMTWCEALVRDLELWRAGELQFERIERTVVLSSDPGLGKTTLVRSLAKTAGLPLVVSSVGSLFATSTGYLDGVIKAWDGVIAQAAAMAPAIVFLDELDGLPNRAAMDAKDRGWWTPVVNHVLTSLDGAASGISARLIIIGATNHAARLDLALIRPGRLSRIIHIGRPNTADLIGILRQHLGNDLPDMDLTAIAQMGIGATGAEVMGWVKRARGLARSENRPMKPSDLLAQVAPADTREPEAVLLCARHEAAHAVVAEIMTPGSVRSVSVIERDGAGGATRTKGFSTGTAPRADLERYAIVSLAGRAMDELSGTATTGAGGTEDSDLGLATRVVAALHASWGLGGSLLHRAVPEEAVEVLNGDPEFRHKVEQDLDRLYARAVSVVRENHSAIEVVARRLVERRFLDGDEFRELLASASQTTFMRQGTAGGRNG
jgi:hypothetical protein